MNLINFSFLNWSSSYIINHFIGKYFKKFDRNNININLWGGEIMLRDVELNNDLLN